MTSDSPLDRKCNLLISSQTFDQNGDATYSFTDPSLLSKRTFLTTSKHVDMITNNKTKKSVNFSNKTVINEVESHTSYSHNERLHTWYTAKEIFDIYQNIGKIMALVQDAESLRLINKCGKQDRIDDIESIKFSQLDKFSSDERNYVVRKCLKKQKIQKGKSIDKNNDNFDELSRFYSSLAAKHKNLAQEYAIETALIVKHIYIQDGFLPPITQKENQKQIMQDKRKKDWRGLSFRKSLRFLWRNDRSYKQKMCIS